MCNWGLRQTAELENQMTSVERILEYTKLPSERSLKTEPEVLQRLSKSWGNLGEIEFKNVSLKYSPNGEFVLRDLSFKIGEKVLNGQSTGFLIYNMFVFKTGKNWHSRTNWSWKIEHNTSHFPVSCS